MLLQKRIQTLSQIAEHREIVIAELNAAAQVPPMRTNQKLEVSAINILNICLFLSV